jgi:hypothetical protein
MKGVEPAEAGWLTRLIYWFVRRNFGKLTGKSSLPERSRSRRITTRLLRAMGQKEGRVSGGAFGAGEAEAGRQPAGSKTHRLSILN